MRMTLWVSSTFEAAHELSMVFGGGHKCSRMHGHRYKVVLHVGAEDDGEALLVDYCDMQKRLNDEASALDHRLLNEIIPIPTVEHLCRWFWTRLRDMRPVSITVQEQEGTGCTLSET